jgi:hypothetical protein
MAKSHQWTGHLFGENVNEVQEISRVIPPGDWMDLDVRIEPQRKSGWSYESYVMFPGQQR